MRLLPIVLLVACSKREEAKPAPEGKASAAPAVEYTLEQLTCNEGKLGVVAPAPSASASVASVPDAGRAKGEEGTMGAPLGDGGSYGAIGALSSVFGGDAGSLWAPIGDGGLGIGLGTMGGFGHGTGAGYGGVARRLHHAITIVPTSNRGARAMSAAKSLCAVTDQIRTCHQQNDHPVGAMTLDVTIADGKLTKSKAAAEFAGEKLAACIDTALRAIAFEPDASGDTTFKITFAPGRVPPAAAMKETGVTITGRLPPEVVRRIVRMNFPRLRACYDAGLKKEPTLAGNITVEFTIGKTGEVAAAKIAAATLSAEPVQTCVLGVFKTLSFPEPEGGTVSVKYPIDFTPPQ